jgi:hypothetical protein
MRWIGLPALALFGAACGSTVIGPGAGGSGSHAGPCPASEPSLHTSCTAEGFRCTYGASARPECHHAWVCSVGQWQMKNGSCLSPPADHCAFQSPPSGDCLQQGDVCIVGDATLCQCTSCAGGPCMAPPAQWLCDAPPATAGCPAKVPNDGTACDQEGLACAYGHACSLSGAQVTCKDGNWRWDAPTPCPT